MNILIWLLTFILVLDCLLLILLVLIQLPKKEAGLGQAFGGGATDALFGAGSGSALTKLTKYTAGIFFALTLLVSMLHARQARARAVDPRSRLSAADKAGDSFGALPKPTPVQTSSVVNVNGPAAAIGTNTVMTNAAAAAPTSGIKAAPTNAAAAPK